MKREIQQSYNLTAHNITLTESNLSRMSQGDILRKKAETYVHRAIKTSENSFDSLNTPVSALSVTNLKTISREDKPRYEAQDKEYSAILDRINSHYVFRDTIISNSRNSSVIQGSRKFIDNLGEAIHKGEAKLLIKDGSYKILKKGVDYD